MKEEPTPAKKTDPYVSQVTYTKAGKSIRRETKGKLVVVSDLVSDNRGLILIPQQTRVLCKNEIHELIVTDEVDAVPGENVYLAHIGKPTKPVDRIAHIGFFEISQGGCVGLRDPVFINDKEIGRIAGFNDIHCPNHYNIVVLASKRFSGQEAGFHIGDKVRIGSRS